jgi:hypothetical protein
VTTPPDFSKPVQVMYPPYLLKQELIAVPAQDGFSTASYKIREWGNGHASKPN